MIEILSIQDNKGYKVSLNIQSAKDQETIEIYSFIKFMLSHDPEMINAILDELMPDISESTYNMDPYRWAAYKMVLENIINDD